MPAWYVRLEDILAKFLLAAITVLVLIAAISRTIGHPVIWSDDMAQLLFVWLCVFGATRAMRLQTHMAVDYLVKWLPRTPRWLLLLGVVLMIVSLGLQRGLWGLGESLWALVRRKGPADAAAAAAETKGGQA